MPRLIIVFVASASGEIVAQFKYTMLLMPNGPMKITGLPFEADCYQSEYSIEDEDLKVITPASVPDNRSQTLRAVVVSDGCTRSLNKMLYSILRGAWVGGIKTFAIFCSRVLYSTCYLQLSPIYLFLNRMT